MLSSVNICSCTIGESAVAGCFWLYLLMLARYVAHLRPSTMFDKKKSSIVLTWQWKHGGRGLKSESSHMVCVALIFLWHRHSFSVQF
jgi:hypothetical protein